MECRVLESKKCTITQGCKSSHVAVDLVKEGYKLDNITAHSDGVVVQVIKNCNINTSGDSRYNSPYRDSSNPGNMVKIEHGNGYCTRYLHLAYNTVKVNVGDKVKAGQILGYMGNTGYSFGGHLHFEVLENGKAIDPTNYLNKDLPINKKTVNVYYRVKTQKHGWLPEVKNLEDYAGWENSPITGLAVKVDKGSIKYRVHIKGGKWLGWITKYDLNDYHYGYAGDNKPIDAVEVYYSTPNDIRPYKRAKYKVNNYSWQYDNETSNGQDGYAGLMGVNATKFQIVIE